MNNNPQSSLFHTKTRIKRLEFTIRNLEANPANRGSGAVKQARRELANLYSQAESLTNTIRREKETALRARKGELETKLKHVPFGQSRAQHDDFYDDRKELSNIYNALDKPKATQNQIKQSREGEFRAGKEYTPENLSFEQSMRWIDRKYGHLPGYAESRDRIRKALRKGFNIGPRNLAVGLNVGQPVWLSNFAKDATSNLRSTTFDGEVKRKTNALNLQKVMGADPNEEGSQDQATATEEENRSIRHSIADELYRKESRKVSAAKGQTVNVTLPVSGQKVPMRFPANMPLDQVAGKIRDYERNLFMQSQVLHPDVEVAGKALSFDPVQFRIAVMSKKKFVELKDGRGWMPIDQAAKLYGKVLGMDPNKLLDPNSEEHKKSGKLTAQFGYTEDSLDTQLKNAGVDDRLAGIIKRNPGIKDDSNGMLYLRALNSIQFTELASIALGDRRSNEERARSVIRIGGFEISENAARMVVDFAADAVIGLATAGATVAARAGTQGAVKAISKLAIAQATKSAIEQTAKRLGVKLTKEAIEQFSKAALVRGVTKAGAKAGTSLVGKAAMKGAKELGQLVAQSVPQVITNADDISAETGKSFRDSLGQSVGELGKSFASSFDARVLFDESKGQDEKLDTLVNLGSMGLQRVKMHANGKKTTGVRTEIKIPTDFSKVDISEIDRTGIDHAERVKAIEALRKEDGYTGLLGMFKEAGTFKNDSEYEAAEHLLAARAVQWGREQGKPPEQMYSALKSSLNERAPRGSLHQDNPHIPNASFEHLKGLVEKAKAEGRTTLFVQFTLSDQAAGGVVKSPTGADIQVSGGPSDVTEKFPFKVKKEQDASKLEKAEVVFTLNTGLMNVLASNGVKAMKAEINHLLTESESSPAVSGLREHLQKVVESYNSGTAEAKKIKLPKQDELKNLSHREFFDLVLGQLEPENSTFKARNKIASGFYDGTVAANAVDMAKLLSIAGVEKRTNFSLLSMFMPNKDKTPNRKTGDSVYPSGVRGDFAGLMPHVMPKELFPELYAHYKKDKNGKVLSDAQASFRLAIALQSGSNIDGTGRKQMNARLKAGTSTEEWRGYKVEIEAIEKLFSSDNYFFQKNQEGVKAWFNASTNTIGAIAGKSDFSSFAHEVSHFWSQSLSDDHNKRLEAHYGNAGTPKREEAVARDFERYMRDGRSPSSSLIPTFVAIKNAITGIYKTLKGTPIEKEVHPEVRAVFDEMLGGKPIAQKGTGTTNYLPVQHWEDEEQNDLENRWNASMRGA